MAGKQDAGITEATPLMKRLSMDESARGQATVGETILNLSKTCMGTGCLALAYACQQGGVLVYCFGLIAIAAWNVYAVDRLVRCRGYLLQDAAVGENDNTDQEQITTHVSNLERNTTRRKVPKESTSTLGKVAFLAFGPTGLEVIDILMMILLMGIVVSYLSAVISFLSDTPLTIGPLGDALVVATLMLLLSLVPDLGHLSGISGAGLMVLGGTFIVIAGYGIHDYWTSSQHGASLPLWPTSKTGLSHFFGVCVFGFGTVPLTYNFQESMRNPDLIVPSTAGALGGVALAYIILGVGLSLLFPTVSGEVLHELPAAGWLPTTTRLAMALVVVLTAPLLIVPAGELLEGKFHGNKVLVRCGVCLVGVFVAVLLPTFVQVLAFVGCACVGFVSFCVPPILHMRLLWRLRKDDSRWMIANFLFDCAMLTWGLIATVLGTIFTLS